jgi:hypothetical protein
MTGTPISPAVGRILLAKFLVLFCGVFRSALEADPVTHMLIQLPALAWAGWLLAAALSARIRSDFFTDLNRGGWAGLLIALFTIFFWMLPRSIDGALASPAMEIAKFITIPLLVGAPLRWSWRRAHALLRGVLMCNAVSMCGVLAWLYTAAPIRVCNSYLVDDQQRLGLAFLLLSIGLALAWGGRAFFPPQQASPPTPGNSSIAAPGGNKAI